MANRKMRGTATGQFAGQSFRPRYAGKRLFLFSFPSFSSLSPPSCGHLRKDTREVTFTTSPFSPKRITLFLFRIPLFSSSSLLPAWASCIVEEMGPRRRTKSRLSLVRRCGTFFPPLSSSPAHEFRCCNKYHFRGHFDRGQRSSLTDSHAPPFFSPFFSLPFFLPPFLFA